MDCIVWTLGLARTPEDELPPPVPGTSLRPGEIDEEEKERIRIMQLEESESEQEMSEQAGTSTAIGDSEDEESDTDYPIWRNGEDCRGYCLHEKTRAKPLS